MGLDIYASNTPDEVNLTPKQAQAFEEADIRLCGGILSGGGGSFRGKVYVHAIVRITGINLCQDWIPPETVRRMYHDLAICDPQQVAEESSVYDMAPEEIIGLRNFFRVCSEHGLGLIGWW